MKQDENQDTNSSLTSSIPSINKDVFQARLESQKYQTQAECDAFTTGWLFALMSLKNQ